MRYVVIKVVIWDQPWTKTRQVTKWECSPGHDAAAGKARTARADSQAPAPIVIDLPTAVATPAKPPITGGYHTAETTRTDIQDMAKFATESLSKSSNAGPLNLIRVTSAATQVVAGTN